MTHFDAIIIGSGQGGTPLSKKLAGQGWKTALIEQADIGGTCINTGCTPTKTMIASAKVAYTLRTAEKYGVRTTGNRIDIRTVLARKDGVVKSFRNSSQEGLQQTENLQLLFGSASFVGKKKLRVQLNEGGALEISADKIFIDTGGRPAIPAIGGLEAAGYFTSTTLMQLQLVPEHLLVIGGGYIGLEFGQMYRRFGSMVTVLESNHDFLPKEDADIAAEVLRFLEEENIRVHTSAKVKRVKKTEGGITVNVTINNEEKELACSHVLVSAGRVPNTDALNLSATGVSTDKKGYITVDDQLQTTCPDIYAIGDVKGGPAFTHISYHDHVILYQNIIGGKKQSIQDRMVPYTMFTDPQLGRVGISEKEAKEKGLKVKVAKLPMTRVSRAIETGDTRGLMKAVVDAEKDVILGAAVLAPEGGEIMTVLQMAMLGRVKTSQIKEMVIAHPLFAESLNNLFTQWE